VLNLYDGAIVPHKLGIGDAATVTMEHDLAFDGMLNKRTVYFLVWHAFAKRPVEVPIFLPTKK
jgi:hypothetical protein